MNPTVVLKCLKKWRGDPYAGRVAKSALMAYRLLNLANHELANVFSVIIFAERNRFTDLLTNFLDSLTVELVPNEESRDQNRSICALNKIPDNVKSLLSEILVSCWNILTRDMLKTCQILPQTILTLKLWREKFFLTPILKKLSGSKKVGQTHPKSVQF